MIGRFQVMAMLQAARAHSLGFSLDEAKSFGLDRAIFYAAAKRGFKRTPAQTTRAKEELHGKGKYGNTTIDTESLGDEMAYCVHVDGKRIFVIGGEPLEPEDFDRQIMARFSTKYEPAWQEALETIKHFDPETLK